MEALLDALTSYVSTVLADMVKDEVGMLKVIGCSSLRGGGGELGSNKNLDLWLQLVCTKLKLKHAI